MSIEKAIILLENLARKDGLTNFETEVISLGISALEKAKINKVML